MRLPCRAVRYCPYASPTAISSASGISKLNEHPDRSMNRRNAFCFFLYQMLVAGSEGFSKNLNVAAKKALVSLGAGNEEVTALGERNVFVMIGRKGAKPGSVPQV